MVICPKCGEKKIIDYETGKNNKKNLFIQMLSRSGRVRLNLNPLALNLVR